MQTGTPGESPSEYDKDESQSEKRCRHTREALQTLLNVIVSSNSDNEEIEAKKSNDGILKLALHRLAKRNLSLEMQLKHLVAEQRCQCPAELGELVIENGPSPYTPDPANFSPQKSGVWSPSFTIAKITPRANYSSSTASDSDLRALQTRCEKFGKENAKMRMELQKLKITLENERIEKALQPIHVRQASKKKKQQQKLIDDGDDGKRPSPVRLFKATRKFGTKIGHASGHHKHSSKNKNPAQNPGSQVINEGEIAPTSKLHPCVCLHDSNSTNSHTTPPT
ncbi:unnamed protein product [Notodromas monacha]|uniref:Uncharacterized protein n=1 Tax=Notodromas monacha TaxID=399045 RepID=A0A7R9GLD4_9CRUS|nr:unnamed protein product [Notodromas monacha]CAG0924810.1 unnamed protein product [Notodromas monacha]